MIITKKHREVLDAILKKIIPSKEDIEKQYKIQKEILDKIKVPYAKAMVGGSGAKQTWLKDTHDIDIYVKFSYSKYNKKSEQLSDILSKYLKKSFKKIIRIHGSRDYFQVNYKKHTIEIVPILEIKNKKQAKNITDYSTFHVDYITKQIKKSKNLSNEIRVAKVFAKANRFYGAESHIKGFSGYALELLVSHYGSFLKFITAVSKWKSTTIIGNKKTASELNWAKKVSPLILIDPVQPDRNVAAALSNEQYKNIISTAKAFLKKPSFSFFEKKEVDIISLQRKGHLTIITARPITAKKDVAGAKALKAFEYLVNNTSKFEVVDSFFDYADNSTTFYVVTKKSKLSKEYKHEGPPITNKTAYLAFKKANKGLIKVDKKEKRYYIMKKRKNQDVLDHIKSLLTQEEVTSRIKDITIYN